MGTWWCAHLNNLRHKLQNKLLPDADAVLLLPDTVWGPLLSFEQVTEQATTHMYSSSYYLMMCYYFEESGEGDGDGNATCRCRSIMVMLGTVGDGLPHVVYRLGGQHPPRPSPERPADDAPEHVHAATAPPPPWKPARHQKRQIWAVPAMHTHSGLHQ